jgi:hypothetical protein
MLGQAVQVVMTGGAVCAIWQLTKKSSSINNSVIIKNPTITIHDSDGANPLTLTD